MFDFLRPKSKKLIKPEYQQLPATDDEDEDTSVTTASGFAATESARISTQKAATKYAKPDSYTGSRQLYDSGAAKKNAKLNLFNSSAEVVDPYTGDHLVLTRKEARIMYGDDWTKHLAESDHVKPLEQIYKDTKGNVWNTTDDIKAAANSSDNIVVTSRKTNNAKRSRTNEEYVNDRDYREQKGVEFTEEGERQALQDGLNAEQSINRQLRESAVKNVLQTGHEAGVEAATSAGVTSVTMSGIMNIVSVVKGEKDVGKALADTAKDTGKAAVTGYIMGDGLTVVQHTLSNSGSKFLKALSDNNVPGKVITAVMATGNTFKKYANGEISTQECLIELGDKGLNLATAGYSMAIGQALIPIPIVGGAIGALVGTALTSEYYHRLVESLQMKQLEHEERQRIIAECATVAAQAKSYRVELEAYLDSYFQDYHDCFDTAISQMQFAFQAGDADTVIINANQITKKLGGNVYYNNVDEFKNFLNSDEVEIF